MKALCIGLGFWALSSHALTVSGELVPVFAYDFAASEVACRTRQTGRENHLSVGESDGDFSGAITEGGTSLNCDLIEQDSGDVLAHFVFKGPHGENWNYLRVKAHVDEIDLGPVTVYDDGTATVDLGKVKFGRTE